MDGAGFYQYGLTFSNGGNADGNSLDFFITATNVGKDTANVTGVAADVCRSVNPTKPTNCGSGDNLTGAVKGTLVPVPAPFVGAGTSSPNPRLSGLQSVLA